MKRSFLLGLLCLCIVLAGCASTSMKVETGFQPAAGEKFQFVITPEDIVPEKTLAIMNDRLQAQLGESLLRPGETALPDRNVEIVITRYNMRNEALRFWVGVAAGADHIDSTVTVRDSSSGRILGVFEVESTNTSGWGTSRGLIESHVDQIVRYLKNGH
ncbi:MAG: DUF4410 domain-containing protein [Stenotrophobium sp.]